MKRNIVIGSLVVVLSACGEGGDLSTGSPVIGGETQLSAPELEDRSSKVLKIKWDYVSGADKYKLFRNGQSIYTGSSRYYTDSVTNGLQQNVGYTYKFSYTDRSGKESALSDVSPAFYLLNDATVLPATPSNVEWTKRWKNKIEIKWRDNADNEEGFEVYQDSQKVIETEFGTEEATIANLSPDTQYNFTVKAKNAKGLSQASQPLIISTLSIKRPKPITNIQTTTTSDSVTFTYNVDSSSPLKDPDYIYVYITKKSTSQIVRRGVCYLLTSCIADGLDAKTDYEYSLHSGNWGYEKASKLIREDEYNSDTFNPSNGSGTTGLFETK